MTDIIYWAGFALCLIIHVTYGKMEDIAYGRAEVVMDLIKSLVWPLVLCFWCLYVVLRVVDTLLNCLWDSGLESLCTGSRHPDWLGHGDDSCQDME